MSKRCAYCGREIKNSYFKVLDNFLIIKYFDYNDDNLFCSPECFCDSVFLEEFEVEVTEDE